MRPITRSALVAAGLLLAAGGRAVRAEDGAAPTQADHEGRTTMELGAFSVSLAVKDLAASREFYGKLGFTPFAGDPAQNWQILRNGHVVIGLFQGMFERNLLTFNPGWDQDAQARQDFTDVRELQARLKELGVAFVAEAEEGTTGPASFVVVDPDGNPVLVDQHVPAPAPDPPAPSGQRRP